MAGFSGYFEIRMTIGPEGWDEEDAEWLVAHSYHVE